MMQPVNVQMLSKDVAALSMDKKFTRNFPRQIIYYKPDILTWVNKFIVNIEWAWWRKVKRHSCGIKRIVQELQLEAIEGRMKKGLSFFLGTVSKEGESTLGKGEVRARDFSVD
ncbi:unnamed protein product [Linum tenue]|uniref:Uncharacterized protein n=1 Tax=Linum tenue TaxID=586396 RepID=A0AAV0RQA9_9ROSI|nr:unnamed protein product [Linum tenue]